MRCSSPSTSPRGRSRKARRTRGSACRRRARRPSAPCTRRRALCVRPAPIDHAVQQECGRKVYTASFGGNRLFSYPGGIGTADGTSQALTVARPAFQTKCLLDLFTTGFRISIHLDSKSRNRSEFGADRPSEKSGDGSQELVGLGYQRAARCPGGKLFVRIAGGAAKRRFWSRALDVGLKVRAERRGTGILRKTP